MASTTTAGAGSGILVFFVIIILIIARRIYRNVTGVRVSRTRTVGYTIFYFAFGFLFVGTSFLEGVPGYYLVPDAAVLALGAFLSHRLSSRRLRFWKSPDGTIFYKGGIVIYLIYVVGLAARLGIEFVLVGPSAFNFSSAPVVGLGPMAVLGLSLADLLLAFGIGLLIGRNVRVYSEYSSIVQGKVAVPAETP